MGVLSGLNQRLSNLFQRENRNNEAGEISARSLADPDKLEYSPLEVREILSGLNKEIDKLRSHQQEAYQQQLDNAASSQNALLEATKSLVEVSQTGLLSRAQDAEASGFDGAAEEYKPDKKSLSKNAANLGQNDKRPGRSIYSSVDVIPEKKKNAISQSKDQKTGSKTLKLSFRAHQIIPRNSPYNHYFRSLLNSERFLAEEEYAMALDVYQRLINKIPNRTIRGKIQQNIDDIQDFLDQVEEEPEQERLSIQLEYLPPNAERKPDENQGAELAPVLPREANEQTFGAPLGSWPGTSPSSQELQPSKTEKLMQEIVEGFFDISKAMFDSKNLEIQSSGTIEIHGDMAEKTTEAAEKMSDAADKLGQAADDLKDSLTDSLKEALKDGLQDELAGGLQDDLKDDIKDSAKDVAESVAEGVAKGIAEAMASTSTEGITTNVEKADEVNQSVENANDVYQNTEGGAASAGGIKGSYEDERAEDGQQESGSSPGQGSTIEGEAQGTEGATVGTMEGAEAQGTGGAMSAGTMEGAEAQSEEQEGGAEAGSEGTEDTGGSSENDASGLPSLGGGPGVDESDEIPSLEADDDSDSDEETQVQEIKGVLELKSPEQEDTPFLTLTYDFNKIPHGFSLSSNHNILEYAYYKYKPMLVKAQKFIKRKQINRALNYYRVIREQEIPPEFKTMVDRNIEDITEYLQKYLMTRQG